MSPQKLVGPASRAADLRRAANRLRWEIDAALGLLGDDPALRSPAWQIGAASDDLAETLAILANVMSALDEHLPSDDPSRESFSRLAQWYREYHEVPR